MHRIQEEIEKELEEPKLWEDRQRSRELLQKKSKIESELEFQKKLEESINNSKEYLYFAEEGEEEAISSFIDSVKKTEHVIGMGEIRLLFVKEEDVLGAIVELHAGAGGKDAQDWTEMLSRMYERYAIQKGYTVSCVHYIPGDEAGIKSISLEIEGEYAFGFLQYERGIHRLIRISPFDSSGKRHTSFASVDVLPLVEEKITIEIKENDLRIDTFRSSGPGGQSVNTTSSAVRITHIPSGIVVQCQNEKSQHANKDSAMRILKARLYRVEQEKMQEQKQSSYSSKDAINFGSQIRTYTMHPYTLVKDHRTQTENTDINKVLDGELSLFLQNSIQHYTDR